jgi:hypothetical protein
MKAYASLFCLGAGFLVQILIEGSLLILEQERNFRSYGGDITHVGGLVFDDGDEIDLSGDELGQIECRTKGVFRFR